MNGALVLLAGPIVSFVSADPLPVVNFNGLWAWTFAALDPGQSMTFTLEVDANRAEILAAAAAVGADSRDPKVANNVAGALTIVK